MHGYYDGAEHLVAYNEMVKARINEGWTPYLLTFMFADLAGNRQAQLSQMHGEIERVYSMMVTRVVRLNRPGQPLPVWIASPDLPVAKNKKVRLDQLPLNDGIHFHAVCLIPPTHRLKTGLTDHVDKYRNLYLRDRRVLRNLHVQYISTDPGYVTEYALKSLLRARLDPDSLLVLPRAQSEMPVHRGKQKAESV